MMFLEREGSFHSENDVSLPSCTSLIDVPNNVASLPPSTVVFRSMEHVGMLSSQLNKMGLQAKSELDYYSLRIQEPEAQANLAFECCDMQDYVESKIVTLESNMTDTKVHLQHVLEGINMWRNLYLDLRNYVIPESVIASSVVSTSNPHPRTAKLTGHLRTTYMSTPTCM